MNVSSDFALAIVVIAGMVVALLYTGVIVARGFGGTGILTIPERLEFAIPLLALAGFGVSSYLTYVEARALPVICGPIGDCNAVQSSPYARLFGMPVSVLGAASYAAIVAGWFWGRWRSAWLADYAPVAVFCLTLFGTLFSLYLTYLEPFVIRAVCVWCLVSAIIMTLLLILSAGPMLRGVAFAGREADPD